MQVHRLLPFFYLSFLVKLKAHDAFLRLHDVVEGCGKDEDTVKFRRPSDVRSSKDLEALIDTEVIELSSLIFCSSSVSFCW